MKTAVFSFGRMNPPTTGHQKLVDKVRTVARLEKGDPLIYLSHTFQDKKDENGYKDPLDYNTKIKYAQKAFGKLVIRSDKRIIVDILKELESQGYTDVVMVVGSDRMRGMEFIKKANGKDYNFDSIELTSAGQRDPDADGVEGMSASKMREFAANDDLENFKQGLAKSLQRDAEKIMKNVQKGM